MSEDTNTQSLELTESNTERELEIVKRKRDHVCQRIASLHRERCNHVAGDGRPETAPSTEARRLVAAGKARIRPIKELQAMVAEKLATGTGIELQDVIQISKATTYKADKWNREEEQRETTCLALGDKAEELCDKVQLGYYDTDVYCAIEEFRDFNPSAKRAAKESKAPAAKKAPAKKKTAPKSESKDAE